MDVLNILLILFFAAACVWLVRILIRQKKQIILYCKFWNASRVMILIAAVLCFMPFLALDFRPVTILRSLMMAAVIGMFALISDGLCRDGFMYMGSKILYKEITEYDVKAGKKKCSVIVTIREVSKKGKVSTTQMVFDFELKHQEEVTRQLKEAIGKKYRRMKIGK